MTDPLAATFARCRAEGRAALVCYLPAGFPSTETGADVARAVVDGGADIVEVGVPYSDPVMEGPTIQRAMDTALRAGARIHDVLTTVERVAAVGVPALAMTYWSPVERYGVDRFARDIAAAGGAGLITPDLLPEEAEPWLMASDAHALARIFLVAPSSTDARIALTARLCRGFVYATSVMGVTGARSATSDLAPALVARVRAARDIPVGVGLGVSNGAQAAEVGRYADAVIVGSALVRRVAETASGVSDTSDTADAASPTTAARAFTAELAEGVRRARADISARGSGD